MERILKQTQAEPVRIFVVWEPMLPTDWYRPTRPTLNRVSDSRAEQFWDKSHLIATQLKQQLEQFHGNNPRCCENGGHLWDMAAVYPPGVKWGEAAPVFDDGPVYRIAPTLQQTISETGIHKSAAVGN
jgi:hypothetical protein